MSYVLPGTDPRGQLPGAGGDQQPDGCTRGHLSVPDIGKVAICLANNHNYTPSAFFWSYNQLLKPSSSHAVHGGASTKAGSLNEATWKALTYGADWLFFMDVDMTFPPDALLRLMSHAAADPTKKILGGLYHQAMSPFSPVAGWEVVDPKGPLGINYHNAKGSLWSKVCVRFPNGLTEVGFTGAGCILIHKDVFKAIGWPAWQDIYHESLGQRILGHDMNLCRRARIAGFKIYVDGDIDCGHLRYHAVDRRFVDTLYDSTFWQTTAQLEENDAKEPRYWDMLHLGEHLQGGNRAPAYAPEHAHIASLISKGSRVADLGAGPGEFLDRLAQDHQCITTGIDFAQSACDLMRSKGHTAIQADLRTWEANGTSATQDVAVCNHALEHIVQDSHVVQQMASLVRPGGMVIVSVPIAHQPDSPAEIEHVRVYTQDSLAALLNIHLTDVSVQVVGHSFVGAGIVPAPAGGN